MVFSSSNLSIATEVVGMKNLRTTSDKSGVIAAVFADCSNPSCISPGAMEPLVISEEELGCVHWFKCPSCDCSAYVRLQTDHKGIRKAEDYGIVPYSTLED
jgi:hypothetical protein